MGKSIIVIIAAIGAATLSRTTLASGTETSAAAPGAAAPGTPASGAAGNASAAQMAEAYWLERSGDLPPYRPVIVLTPPRQASHSPPSAAHEPAQDVPGVTVPAGRAN